MSVQEKIHSADPSRYVVLDVETNGLSAANHDLLSISMYKPDTGEKYNRFLPLELDSTVLTSEINGIWEDELLGLLPLSQDEVDSIVEIFELKKRIVLTYGGLDKRFIKKYFERHQLKGIEYFDFYNFKHMIISSSFSEGNITKDNLCALFEIDNVQKVHSGTNDCILEWKLFERMNGNPLLITKNKVFEFNDKYIVPASYLSTYPNFKYYLPDLPKITCKSKTIFMLPISADNILKFPTNFNGMIAEHLINSMLQVVPVHSERELLKNKMNLKYIGTLPSDIVDIPMIFNPDGSMTAMRSQDRSLAEDINGVINTLKSRFEPLISFIKNDIFHNQTIMSQELVISPEKKVLALCDLSSESAVLEIKCASHTSAQRYAEQLYYEANGRNCYIMLTDWSYFPEKIVYIIREIAFDIEEYVDPKMARFEKAKQKTETETIELLSFTNTSSPVRLRCKVCGNEWEIGYITAQKHRPCPYCTPKIEKATAKRVLTDDEKAELAEQTRKQRLSKYQAKLDKRSGSCLTVLSYTNSASPARAKCVICGYEWETRADHLLERPNCPKCRKRIMTKL